MKEIQLRAPYGKIHMNVLLREDITPKQKLVYAIISAKQGATQYAKVTQKMIADAIGLSERYVSTTIVKLTELGLIRRKGSEYHRTNKSRQYGMVELDLLITTNLSYKAKYLYLIYCAVGNKEYDANNWSSRKICAEFHIGMSTYQKAHKELIDNKLLNVYGMASGNRVQTSNMNKIIRVEGFTIVIPDSWTTPEALDVDAWCEINLQPEPSVEPKPELSVEPNRNSRYNLTGTEGITNSNHNNNHNINAGIVMTNQGFDQTLAVDITESTTDEIDATEEEEFEEMPFFDADLFGKLAFKRSKTPEEAMQVIHDLNNKATEGGSLLDEYIEDDELMGKAFKAHEVLCEFLESRGIDTEGYGLDYDDLQRFSSFYNRNVTASDDDALRYHVERVAELGMDREGKKYISFSYVFASHADMKIEPFI